MAFHSKGSVQGTIVAQYSATPASVAATPPCSATPFQRQLDVRPPWQLKGDSCDRAFFRGGGGVARYRCYTEWRDSRESIRTIRANRVLRTNRKFE